jgi:hypothetical protein
MMMSYLRGSVPEKALMTSISWSKYVSLPQDPVLVLKI